MQKAERDQRQKTVARRLTRSAARPAPLRSSSPRRKRLPKRQPKTPENSTAASRKRPIAKARFAEIRQLVEQKPRGAGETDDYYNFQDGTTIRRISVTPELRKQLIGGSLAIVRCEGRYASCRQRWVNACAAGSSAPSSTGMIPPPAPRQTIPTRTTRYPTT